MIGSIGQREPRLAGHSWQLCTCRAPRASNARLQPRHVEARTLHDRPSGVAPRGGISPNRGVVCFWKVVGFFPNVYCVEV